MIFLKTIIGIYALLMIIASTQSLIKDHDTNKKFHYINFVISIALLVSLIFMPRYYLIISIPILLIGYQILAIYRGLSTNSFHWQHHIARLSITIVMIMLLLLI
ncbi:hypothetical protein EFN45_09210 [Leuconostoc citreum]|nr:hypothetical protein [Leuconostoc citreum]